MFEFEDVIRSASIYLAAKDKNLKYLYCNENVAMRLGLDSPNQIIGKTDFDLFENDIACGYHSGDVHVINGGTFLNVREILPHFGQTLQILTTKNQLKNKRGDETGVVVSYFDITGLTAKLPSDIMQYDHKRKSYKFQLGRESEFFTKREYDIFKYIIIGFTTKKIARHLLLSPRTIEDYIEKIKVKLQCTSKHHIAEAAMRLGLIQQNILNSIV